MPLDTQSLFRVDGLVAVITGGGTGIGLMAAQALAAAGASKVFILGRRLPILEQAASEHPAFIPIQCDVTSKDSLAAAAATVAEQTPHVNFLFANSGIHGPGTVAQREWDLATLQAAFWKDDMGDFTAALHANVTGVQYTILAFLNLLGKGNEAALAGGYGAPLATPPSEAARAVPSIQSQILITSSVAAHMRSIEMAFAYSSSKAAATKLGMLWASRLAPYGIRCNVIEPGFFPSEMAAGLVAGRDPAAEPADHPKFIPARKFGSAEEMGGSILYLTSRAGAFMNGCVFLPDGGRLSVTQSSY